MASVMAIVSKAVFETIAPKNVAVGARIATDRYASKNRLFDALAEGGALFLVTVRPPGERLWLVAILEAPKASRGAWVGAPNATPIADVTAALPRLKLESGQGIHAKKGALGMSLQTPRVLTEADERVLRALAGKGGKAKPTSPKVATRPATSEPAKPARPTAVAWEKLNHARGSARKVGDQLAALAHPATRKVAMQTLREAFVQTGDAFSASAPFFAALVALACDARSSGREPLLAFALDVLALGDVAAVAVAPAPRRRYTKPAAKELLRAASDHADALDALSRDTSASPELRGRAVTLLGHLHDAATTIVPRLVARLAAEAEPDLRARLVFAAMHLALGTTDVAVTVRPALARLRAAGDPLTRGATAIALATLEGRWPAAAKSRAELVAFFTAALPLTTSATHEDLVLTVGNLAFELLARGRASADTHVVGALAALEAMRVTPLPYKAAVRHAWPAVILDRWFPSQRRGMYTYRDAPLDLGKLRGDAKTILLALCSVRTHVSHWNHAGLAPDLRTRRRQLALEPPSVIDDMVKVGKVKTPRWKILRATMDRYDKLKSETPPTLFVYVKANAGFDLTPAQWLELWSETHAGSHGLYCYDRPDPLDDAMAAASPEDLRGWAMRTLDEILGGTKHAPRPLGPDVELRSNLGTAAYRGLVRAGGPVPERYDHALTLFEMEDDIRKLFEAVPPNRRAAAVASILEHAALIGNVQRAKVASNLDLMPDAAAPLIASYDSWKHLKDDREAFAILTKLRKKERAVDKAMTEAERRDKAEPRKPARKPKLPPSPKKTATSTYRFVEGNTYDLALADKLEGVAKKQFLCAAERYGGAPYKTVRSYFTAMAEEMDESPESCTAVGTLWQIERVADGKPVYEMWTFLVDNGTVFAAGTAKPVGVEMIQGGFDGVLGTPESKELADELQEVVPF